MEGDSISRCAQVKRALARGGVPMPDLSGPVLLFRYILISWNGIYVEDLLWCGHVFVHFNCLIIYSWRTWFLRHFMRGMWKGEYKSWGVPYGGSEGACKIYFHNWGSPVNKWGPPYIQMAAPYIIIWEPYMNNWGSPLIMSGPLHKWGSPVIYHGNPSITIWDPHLNIWNIFCMSLQSHRSVSPVISKQVNLMIPSHLTIMQLDLE